MTGPAGFAAYALFDDGNNKTIETWPPPDVSPGPKRKTVTGAGKVHVVYVFVNIDPTQNIDVAVRATVAGKGYCRTVRGAGTQEIITHTIRVA